MDGEDDQRRMAGMISEEVNADILAMEFKWLAEALTLRFDFHFNRSVEPNKSIYDLDCIDIQSGRSSYESIVSYYNMGKSERLVLMMAMAPHFAPQILDMFFTSNANLNRPSTEFGGVTGQNHKGFLPTGETVAFVLAGHNLHLRLQVMRMFEDGHLFAKTNMIRLEASDKDEPLLSGVLKISPEYLTYFSTGKKYKPKFSSAFPAKHLTTQLEWKDLVLDNFVLHEVMEIEAWIEHRKTIMVDWGLGNKIKPGYRTMFYGPPGTGKTLTATLLGKATGLDVYRIDLSKMVSKYIGETEKNLARIFDQAAHKDWILFFDEADALFGRRTATHDSKDRHANQQVAYLLQRIEDFPGVVILATNLKANLDDAFARRFQSMIYFAPPNVNQRLLLWKRAFSDKSILSEEIDLYEIARSYKITGGAIINVLRHCSLAALRRGNNVIRKEDILSGIRREYGKEGKTM